MGKITIIGSFNIDLVCKIPTPPLPYDTIWGEDFLLTAGGKGSNQAICASRLGSEVYFIGCVGKDIFGNIAKETLTKEKINTDYLKVEEKSHTGVAFVLVDKINGDNTLIVCPGANQKLDKRTIEEALHVILNSDIVLLQFEIPIETIEYVIERLKNEFKPKLIVNPAPAKKLRKEIWENLYIITPNKRELETLTDTKINNKEDLIKACKKLLSWGIQNVIVTLGEKGAFLMNKKEAIEIPAYKVDPVDTTGAGDAFNGGLAVALSEGMNLVDAIKFANKVAGLKVKKYGASSMPYRYEIDNLT